MKRFLPLLVKRFDRLISKPRWRRFDSLVCDRSARSDDFFFIQIGANDGRRHDPIFRYITQYGWRGILVEPVPSYFSRLKHNYRTFPQLIFENSAISNADGERDFYRVQEGQDHLPDWCRGIGTLYPQVLLKHRWLIPGLQDYVVKERVKCLSFNSLLEKHKVRKIELLLIDAEGYDYEIIKQVDFKRLPPAIVCYEHKHLSRAHRLACERSLTTHGYAVVHRLGNTLAYLHDLQSR
ncbi:MAG: FkbM family methyltransferase [Gammaproteobacteria bacterium]